MAKEPVGDGRVELQGTSELTLGHRSSRIWYVLMWLGEAVVLRTDLTESMKAWWPATLARADPGKEHSRGCPLALLWWIHWFESSPRDVWGPGN